MYKVVGNIESFNDIPFDKHIIIAGSINGSTAWFFRMPGVFRNDNDDFRFVDDYGMPTRFTKNTPFFLNVLEKEVQS